MKIKIIFALVILLFVTGCQKQENVVMSKPTSTYDILNGRLTIEMPEETQQQPIMSGRFIEFEGMPEEKPLYSDEERTKLVFTNGDETISIVAIELFLISKGDIKQDALKYYGQEVLDSSDYQVFFSKENSQIEACDIIVKYPNKIPPSFSGEEPGVQETLIRMPDNTLIAIQVYVNNKLLDDKKSYRKQIRGFMDSLKYGERTIDYKTENKANIKIDTMMYYTPYENLPKKNPVDVDIDININLRPNYYCTSREESYHINVNSYIYSIKQFSNINNYDNKTYAVLEIGDFTYYENEHEEDAIPANILGEDIFWKLEMPNGIIDKDSYMETYVPLKYEGIKMHITIFPQDEQSLEELRTMVETLTYVK